MNMKCESCHEEISTEAKICPYCEEPVSSDNAAVEGMVNETAEKKEINGTDQIVGINHKSDEIIKQPAQIKAKYKKSSKTVIVIAIAIVMIGSLYVLGYFIFQTGHLSQSMKEIEAGSILDPLTFVSLDGNDAEKFTFEVAENSININVPGEYTIIYTLTNTDTNKSKDLTFGIKVVDTIPPKIKVDDLIKTAVGKEFNILSVIVVTDAVDGVIETKNVSVQGNVDVNKFGTYQLILSVSDKEGNKASKLVNVIVADTTPPEIKADDLIKATFGEEFNILSFITVSDAVDGLIETKNVSIQGNVDINKAGTYQLILSVSDSAGNKAEKTVNVIVEDIGDPNVFFDNIIGAWEEVGGIMLYEFSLKNGVYFMTESHLSPWGYQELCTGVLTFINVNGRNTVADLNWDRTIINQDGSLDNYSENNTVYIDTGAPNDNIISIDLEYGSGLNEYSMVN